MRRTILIFLAKKSAKNQHTNTLLPIMHCGGGDCMVGLNVTVKTTKYLTSSSYL